MSRRSVLASCFALCLAGSLVGPARTAHANGRLPATASINFRQGHNDDILAGLTFGLVISHDGGKTWAWMCDDAIGIANGPYDPVYTYTPAGTIFATTLAGMVVMRDACSFQATPEGKNFVSAASLGPDGAFYYAAAQTADAAHGVPSDFKIYRSTDDGVNFPQAVKPGDAGDANVWWQSITVAPSNKQVIYVSGFRYIPNPQGAGTIREHLVFRSDNGGASWGTPLPLTGLTLAPNSVIHIAAVASEKPSQVYARVEYIDNMTSDGLYLSTDSGVTWTPIHSQPDRFVGFVVRNKLTDGKHDLIAVTAKFGTEISHDDGAHWAPVTTAPHISCLTENEAGELWACTQNYAVAPAPSDDAGIMKSTDLTTWTKVLRYQDMTEAVTGCAAGTTQQKACVPLWCMVCAQLGCTPAASYACPVLSDDAPPMPPRPKAGCCETGGSAGGPLALGLSVATLLLRRRRRPPG